MVITPGKVRCLPSSPCSRLRTRRAWLRVAPLARHKVHVAILSPGANQTFELAHANPETLGRLTLTKTRFHERTHQMRMLPLIELISRKPPAI
jgi:hypothetical protein